MDIVTMGEAMACLVADSSGPLRHVRMFQKHIAGAEFNLAIGAARLGISTGWISRVGQDEFGTEIRTILQGEGVDVSQVGLSDRPTGLYFKEYSAFAEPEVFYYRSGSAASTLGPDDIDPAYIQSARVLHLTGITPLLSAGCQAAVWKAIEIARAAGVKVSFDPNIRYKLIDRAEVPAFFRPFIAAADIVLTGLGEMREILGDSGAEAEALEEQMLALGPGLVVVKSGGGGAVARTASERVSEAAFPVARVVDPIGAGDGFNAGFLSGYLRGWDLQRSLRLGNLVGACAIGVHGDFEGYPDWRDAERLLDRGQGSTR